MYISEPQVVQDLITSLAALIRPSSVAQLPVAGSQQAAQEGGTEGTSHTNKTAPAAGSSQQQLVAEEAGKSQASGGQETQASRKRKAAPASSTCLKHESAGLAQSPAAGSKGSSAPVQEGASAAPRSGDAHTPCIILAHGRNRFAEDAFKAAATAAGFQIQVVGEDELHPGYQCSDVSIYRLLLQ